MLFDTVFDTQNWQVLATRLDRLVGAVRPLWTKFSKGNLDFTIR
jgi:hypothetical protein